MTDKREEEMIKIIVERVTRNVVKEIGIMQEEMKKETDEKINELHEEIKQIKRKYESGTKEDIQTEKKEEIEEKREFTVEKKLREYWTKFLGNVRNNQVPRFEGKEGMISRKKWEILYPLFRDENTIKLNESVIGKYTICNVKDPSYTYKYEVNMNETDVIIESAPSRDLYIVINNKKPVDKDTKRELTCINLKGCAHDLIKLATFFRLKFCVYLEIPKQISLVFNNRIYNVECSRMHNILIGYGSVKSNIEELLVLIASHETKIRQRRRMQYYVILKESDESFSWIMKIEDSPSVKRKKKRNDVPIRHF